MQGEGAEKGGSEKIVMNALRVKVLHPLFKFLSTPLITSDTPGASTLTPAPCKQTPALVYTIVYTSAGV